MNGFVNGFMNGLTVKSGLMAPTSALKTSLARAAAIGVVALGSVALAPGAVAAVDEALALQASIDSKAQASQARIDTMDDSAARLAQQYRSALQRAESLKIYNAQLQKLLLSQEQEKTSLQTQIAQVEVIETGVLPLMIRMTAALDKLVSADAPFLTKERRLRVDELQALIDRADVTVGEKYRRIMEAYVVEADYGKTIEAYQGDVVLNDSAQAVDFLRIGRVGLYYQTLDGNQSGRWNPATSQWELLPASYRTPIRDGLRVARKQAPPELLKLPITAPGV